MRIKPNALYQVDALTLLERMERGQADLVYLDPPWFTARFSENTSDSLIEKRKSYFVLLSKVIQQAHRILSDTGNIFFHIEPSLAGHFRLMLDQTFGIKNFRAEFIWPLKLVPHLRSNDIKISHEIIYFYSKSDDFIFNPQFKIVDNKAFSGQDEKGKYTLGSLFSVISRPLLQFEWQGYNPPPGQSWRYTKDRLDALLQAGQIILLGTNRSGTPRLKMYLSEYSEVNSVWDDVSSILTPTERVKSNSYQRPISLLDRIIRMGSNEGGLIVDPFCGVGTSIVSATSNNRRWIASEPSQDAISIAISRLEPLGIQTGKDFYFANQDFEDKFARIPFYYVPLLTSEDLPIKPLVITEGKTDWKHLKAAYLRFKRQGLWKDFEIEFLEYENETEMGNKTLGQLCQSLAKLYNTRKIICVFDREGNDIIKKFSTPDAPYRSWGNNVFSLVIPTPSHRNNDDDISTSDPTV
jgi:DNA modification methylase